jgi:hypothetical protein
VGNGTLELAVVPAQNGRLARLTLRGRHEFLRLLPSPPEAPWLSGGLYPIPEPGWAALPPTREAVLTLAPDATSLTVDTAAGDLGCRLTYQLVAGRPALGITARYSAEGSAAGQAWTPGLALHLPAAAQPLAVHQPGRRPQPLAPGAVLAESAATTLLLYHPTDGTALLLHSPTPLDWRLTWHQAAEPFVRLDVTLPSTTLTPGTVAQLTLDCTFYSGLPQVDLLAAGVLLTLDTDRGLYAAGEPIKFTLQTARDRRAPALTAQLTVTPTDPPLTTTLTLPTQRLGQPAALTWPLPKGLPDGDYTLTVRLGEESFTRPLRVATAELADLAARRAALERAIAALANTNSLVGRTAAVMARARLAQLDPLADRRDVPAWPDALLALEQDVARWTGESR